MRVLRRVKYISLKERQLGYLLVLPAMMYIAVLIAYPFMTALYLSLTNKVIGKPSYSFVGLYNYYGLFRSSIFRRTVVNSFIFTGTSVSGKLVIGMIIALLLNQKFRGRTILRGLFLLPWIVPVAISALAWLWMYDVSFGIFNYFLRSVGLEGLPWLSHPSLALLSVIVVNIWKGTPFFGLFLLAGLQGIPLELYEAAEIDGAGRWNKFIYITIPQLKYVILTVTLLSTVWTFADFETVAILTRGGPFNTTHIFSTLTYQIGLQSGRLGQGSAVSLFLFPILVVVVFLELKYLREE